MDKRLYGLLLLVFVGVVGLLYYLTMMPSVLNNTEPGLVDSLEDEFTTPQSVRVPYTFWVYGTNRQALDSSITLSRDDQVVLQTSVDDGFLDVELAEQTYHIVVTADGYFDETLTIHPEKGKLNQSEIHLAQQISLNGLVLNQNEEPINNAQVSLSGEEHKFITESNRQGEFKLEAIRAGDYRLQVRHPDYLVYESNYRVTQTNETVKIILPEYANIVVSVLDQDQLPVKSTSVDLGLIEANATVREVTSIETNIKGEVTFAGLERGHYVVESVAEDDTQSASATINATTQAEHHITLQLPEKRFFISGHVYNEINGDAIESVTVVCASLYGGGYHEYVTQADGFFMFDDLKRGNYQLYVAEHPNYITGDFGELALMAVEKPTMLSQPLSENVEGVEIYLKPSWKIRGHVYHTDQTPVENARVGMRINFSPKQVYGFTGSKDTKIYTTTKPDGSYELIGKFEFDHEKSSIIVFAGRDDYGKRYFSNREHYHPSPGDVIENVDIIFSKKPNVKGKVIDQQTRSGVANAQVIFYEEQRQGQDYISYIQRGAAMTNELGEFSLPVDPGNYICTAYAKNLEDTNQTREVTITESDNEILIEMQTGDQSISGVVVDSQQTPIADVKVHIQQAIAQRSRGNLYVDHSPYVTTDSEGQFRFETLTDITPHKDAVFNLIAMPADPNKYKYKIETSVQPGESDVVIVLEDNEGVAEIHGQVIDYEGQPVERFELLVMNSLEQSFSDQYNIVSQDTEGWSSYVSPHGRFQLSNIDVRKGPFTITAKNQELGVGMGAAIDLEPLEIRENVVIQLRPQLTITGRIVDKETMQALEYPVEIIPWLQLNPDNQKQRMFTADLSRRLTLRGVTHEQAWMQDMLPRTMTQDDGRFEINNLPNSRMWLIVSAGNAHPTFLDINPVSINNRMDLGDVPIEIKPAINERMQPIIQNPSN